MLIRRTLQNELETAATQYPVVTITGPRQSGKTTLARAAFPNLPYANLEAPDIRAFALDDPRGFLSQFPQGAIIDEFQRAPDLCSYIQALVDEQRRKGIFVLTGSQLFSMMAGVSQSLAGRTALLTLYPFDMEELERICPGWIPTAGFSRDAFHVFTTRACIRQRPCAIMPEPFWNVICVS